MTGGTTPAPRERVPISEPDRRGLVSHAHPDHCANLNPQSRARTLREKPSAALPVYALPGAVDASVCLTAGHARDHYELREFGAGDAFEVALLH